MTTTLRQQQQPTAAATVAPGRAVVYLWDVTRGAFERVSIGVWISAPCHQCGTWDLWVQLTGDSPPTGNFFCRLCDPAHLGGTGDEVTSS